jgi:hypothetical protein
VVVSLLLYCRRRGRMGGRVGGWGVRTEYSTSISGVASALASREAMRVLR